MGSDKVHMVQQVIKYSDGTETVINYRGVIENGELMADEEEVAAAPAVEEAAPEVAPEAPAEESAPVSE